MQQREFAKSPSSRRRFFGETALVWCGFGAVVFTIYGRALSGWWAFDDPQILKTAFEYDFWAYFILPEAWKALQPANLNPWVLLSFDFDLALFGLNPHGFYIHQLILLWMVTGMTYQLLRRWVQPLWAVAFPLLFLFSAPAANSVYQLMTRNYLEGLFLSILAIHCYLIALKRAQLGWVILGAVFYFCGASAKELYVVLPFMLFLIPVSGWRKRIPYVLPFFIVLGFYLLWRRYMLGVWVGGYARQSIEWLAIYRGILAIPSAVLGNSWAAMVAAGLSSLAVFCAIWRKGALWVWAGGTVLLLLGPIFPVINISDPRRLLMFFVWAVTVALALSFENTALLKGRLRPMGMILIAILGLFLFNRSNGLCLELARVSQKYEVHGRFVMEQSGEQVLLPDSAYGNWFTAGLRWLRIHMLGEEPPKLIYDEVDLAGLKGPVQGVFFFDEGKCELQGVPGGIQELRSQWVQRVRKKIISVEMVYREGAVFWDFGPYSTGSYSVITYGESGSKMVIPPHGAKRMDIVKPLVFRVRYDSPEGWITYSDLLQFDGIALRSLEKSTKAGVLQ